MAKKLLSRLTNQIEWKSLLRGFLLFLSLLVLKVAGFTVLPLLLFFIVAFVVYISEPPERKTLFSSYTILILSSIFVLMELPFVFRVWMGVAVMYGLVFFSIFSFINFRFKNRSFAHGAIQTVSAFSFLLALNLVVSFSAQELGSLLFLLIAFFGLFFLLRESLLFSEGFVGKRGVLISGSITFLCVELLWMVQFLPLGPINTAALVSIFLSLVRDLVITNERGTANFSFILRQITIFAIATLVFFAVSPWNL